MRYKVSNIIEALKTLPEPKYDGQVLNVPILKNISDYRIHDSKIDFDATDKFLVVVAEKQCRDNIIWLEWTCDV